MCFPPPTQSSSELDNGSYCFWILPGVSGTVLYVEQKPSQCCCSMRWESVMFLDTSENRDSSASLGWHIPGSISINCQKICPSCLAGYFIPFPLFTISFEHAPWWPSYTSKFISCLLSAVPQDKMLGLQMIVLDFGLENT